APHEQRPSCAAVRHRRRRAAGCGRRRGGRLRAAALAQNVPAGRAGVARNRGRGGRNNSLIGPPLVSRTLLLQNPRITRIDADTGWNTTALSVLSADRSKEVCYNARQHTSPVAPQRCPAREGGSP